MTEKYAREIFIDCLEYDETSPSCLRWKGAWKRGSTVKIGQPAGSLERGYWNINALGHHYKAHKIVWALLKDESQEGLFIDHINGNPSDNRIENLRLATRDINAQNRVKHKNNTTGITGVVFSEGTTKSGTYFSKYTASIYLRAKKVSTSFSVQKYGDEEAFNLACAWRQKKVDEYLELGLVNFTERHGK